MDLAQIQEMADAEGWEVAWFGLDQAQIWCSEECMVKYAERATSNEPLGRSDPR
jgi:hypothetical protein